MRIKNFSGEVLAVLKQCRRAYRKEGPAGARRVWDSKDHGLHREFDKQWAAQDGMTYTHVRGSKSRLKMVINLCKREDFQDDEE